MLPREWEEEREREKKAVYLFLTSPTEVVGWIGGWLLGFLYPWRIWE